MGLPSTDASRAVPSEVKGWPAANPETRVGSGTVWHLSSSRDTRSREVYCLDSYRYSCTLLGLLGPRPDEGRVCTSAVCGGRRVTSCGVGYILGLCSTPTRGQGDGESVYSEPVSSQSGRQPPGPAIRLQSPPKRLGSDVPRTSIVVPPRRARVPCR